MVRISVNRVGQEIWENLDGGWKIALVMYIYPSRGWKITPSRPPCIQTWPCIHCSQSQSSVRQLFATNICLHNWRAPWKNWIYSRTMNLRKSLVKPMMWQKTCSYISVRFFRPRSSCTIHLMLFSECPPIYASCMTISGGRAKHHVIIDFGELAAVD